jgi:pantothenate kinase
MAAIGDLVRANPGRRVIVGIAGAPGAGKSTLAEAIVAAATDGIGPAVCVPMDGFHLSNVELARLGLAERKGAPETFDAAGFVHLLRRIADRGKLPNTDTTSLDNAPRDEEIVYAPAYSRVLHESIGGVVPVFAGTRLVVVEGNYLLLPRHPWSQVKPLLDLSFYVDVSDEIRVPGLVRRQRARGLDDSQARDWVERSDEANARLVATTRRLADRVLTRAK